MEGSHLSPQLVKIFLTIAAAVVAFIIFNEIYAEIFGKALIG
jgi:hypothetical protein